MGKFRDFYNQIQEEKLLKLKKEGEVPASGELTEPTNGNVTNDVLKAKDTQNYDLIGGKKNDSSDGIIKNQKRDDIPVVAKPVFNKVQKRCELSTLQEDNENNAISSQNFYPNGPIDISDKIIQNPEQQKIKDTFGYDVVISKDKNLFDFITESPMTFQLNEDGIMRCIKTWDNTSIGNEIKKISKKNDKDDEDKLNRFVSYLNQQNKPELEVMKDFLKNFNDYYLFWKFKEQLNSEETQDQIKERLLNRIEDLKNKPDENDEQSKEFYNTLKKMGDITVNDSQRSLQILETISTPEITYFCPSLIDVIRIYDEGETTVKEIPTKIIDIINSKENCQEAVVNESLYKDVLNSTSEGIPFAQKKPQTSEFLKNVLNENLGNIEYEFVSKDTGKWNRITDNGVLIEYKEEPLFTSVDVSDCRMIPYNEISHVLKQGKDFNQKYKDETTISIQILKKCLCNLLNGYCSFDKI